MNQIKLLIVILFAFIVAVFAVSNPQEASLNLFGKEILPAIPMVVVVLGSVLVGVLITAIIGFLYQTKLKKNISKLNKKNKELKEKEEKLQLKIRRFEEQLEETEPEEEKEEENKESG
ncbi:MAG: lipopolysaccharide assembly protein LapA domain-containing protein [Elusimicrobiota bacterium]